MRLRPNSADEIGPNPTSSVATETIPVAITKAKPPKMTSGAIMYQGWPDPATRGRVRSVRCDAVIMRALPDFARGGGSPRPIGLCCAESGSCIGIGEQHRRELRWPE